MVDGKELKEQELEKVNGGFEAGQDVLYSFNAGDCFREPDGDCLAVIGNYKNLKKRENVTCYKRIEPYSSYLIVKCSAAELASYEYVGQFVPGYYG